MNIVGISGYVAAAPRVTILPSGKKVASINLGVRGEYRMKNGEYPRYFFQVECWEKTADFVDRYITKGNYVTVRGYLSQTKYNDKVTGKTVFQVKIQAERLESLSLEYTKQVSDGKPADGNGFMDYVSHSSAESIDDRENMFT